MDTKQLVVAKWVATSLPVNEWYIIKFDHPLISLLCQQITTQRHHLHTKE